MLPCALDVGAGPVPAGGQAADPGPGRRRAGRADDRDLPLVGVLVRASSWSSASSAASPAASRSSSRGP